MEHQQLGSGGPRVSRLCLGTWQLGGDWGEYEQAIAAVGVAFEHGVNFFDTAYGYGEGAAERALARGLGELIASRREELVISTKGGLDLRLDAAGEPQAVYRNSDAEFLRRNLVTSLENLGTEYVDVYFVHWPDPTVPFEEVGETLAGFVAEGLVRHTGVSNFRVEQMEAFAAGGPLDVVQLPYNLLDRRSQEKLIPFCVERGIGIMGYSGLAHGVLSGTLRRGQRFAAGDWRAEQPVFRDKRFERVMDAVEELTAIAASHGCDLPQLALAWILADPAAVVPVIGAQLPAHIVDSARATDVELSAAELERIAAIAAAVPPFEIGAHEQVLARSPGSLPP